MKWKVTFERVEWIEVEDDESSSEAVRRIYQTFAKLNEGFSLAGPFPHDGPND